MKKMLIMAMGLIMSLTGQVLAKDGFEIMVADFAKTPNVISAMKELDGALNNVVTENAGVDVGGLRTKIKDGYYTAQFGAEYKNKNGGKEAAVSDMVTALGDVGVVLQAYYVEENSNPLGSKHKLDKAADKSAYSATHGKYHPDIRAFLEAQGLYDVFLYRLDGQNVYTCFKELDFARKVDDAILASSDLAKVVKAAASSTEADFTILTEMKPYVFSYEQPARFVATPVMDGGKKIGVLVFQLPAGM